MSRRDGLPAGSTVVHVDGSVSWDLASQLALDGRTKHFPVPEVVAIDHPYAIGKYDTWQGVREYFW